MNRNKINRLRFSRLLAVALLVLVAAVLAPGAGATSHGGNTATEVHDVSDSGRSIGF